MKKDKTNHNVAFLSVCSRHTHAIVLLGPPFSHCNTITRIFPKMTSRCLGSNSHSNYYCPMSMVSLQDKESVLLQYSEGKHFGNATGAHQSPCSAGKSVLYSRQCSLPARKSKRPEPWRRTIVQHVPAHSGVYSTVWSGNVDL